VVVDQSNDAFKLPDTIPQYINTFAQHFAFFRCAIWYLAFLKKGKSTMSALLMSAVASF
jgi:hypothetical protein